MAPRAARPHASLASPQPGMKQAGHLLPGKTPTCCLWPLPQANAVSLTSEMREPRPGRENHSYQGLFCLKAGWGFTASHQTLPPVPAVFLVGKWSAWVPRCALRARSPAHRRVHMRTHAGLHGKPALPPASRRRALAAGRVPPGPPGRSRPQMPSQARPGLPRRHFLS